jgi:hypothetical protein
MRNYLKYISSQSLPRPRKLLGDTSGFALVTALMFTLISLTIVSALLYIMTQSTKVSGANKRYKTAIGASYGGAELFAKDILPFLMQNRNLTNTALATLVNTAFNVVNMQVTNTNAACLQLKLVNPSPWTTVANCSNSPNPADNPDMTFKLLSDTGNPYTISSKIVETKIGNTDLSGLQLQGEGVAEQSSSIIPMHSPYIYRLELQGSQSATSEQANIEVLYAY